MITRNTEDTKRQQKSENDQPVYKKNFKSSVLVIITGFKSFLE